ncbi:hypothetical protein [Mesorhizobium sp. LNJC394B00]|uniref:hypothetical protein n=1 Tax=Mesorhizobium sp. LNJC394B00 TaxID=1287274 RepID=UPI0003CE25DC|nr:hypothetical protein [Mesorhizobium sp. LNJC394B00]ESY10779.1 hypothetical protein X750_31960 [Mesorhizobium sp. LNJC394B00]
MPIPLSQWIATEGEWAFAFCVEAGEQVEVDEPDPMAEEFAPIYAMLSPGDRSDILACRRLNRLSIAPFPILGE